MECRSCKAHYCLSDFLCVHSMAVPSFSLCEFFSCFCKLLLHFQISSSSAVDFDDAPSFPDWGASSYQHFKEVSEKYVTYTYKDVQKPQS